MSGSLLNNYSQLDSNILEVQLTLDASRVGMHQVSLTNYDSTSESQIAAGSVIEVNGGLYKFTSNETILDTEGVSDGTVYIMIVPATGSCTAEYTNTAPTWDDSKQGWYGTASTAGYRYLEYIIYKIATSYFPKNKFQFKYKTALWETNLEFFLSANQLISSSADTVIQFDSKTFDYNSEFNAGAYGYICKRSGLYKISGTIVVYNITSPDNNTVKMRVNGISTYQIDKGISTTNYYNNIPINKTIYLSVGDILDFTIDTTTDTSYNISTFGTIMSINQL